MPAFFQGFSGNQSSGRRSRRKSTKRSLRLQNKAALSIEQLEERQLLAADLLFRVNAGGGAVSDTPAWVSDSSFTNTSYQYTSSHSIDLSHASLPAGTPAAMLQSERYDPAGGPEMQWDFTVTPGEYEVRLYFSDNYYKTQGVGKRLFDVAIEGATVLDNYDIYADVGGYTGVMKSFVVQSDGNLDIDFGHVIQNPTIQGIEIVQSTASNQLTASKGTVDFPGTLIGNTLYQTVTLSNPAQAGGLSITIDPSDLSIVGADAGQFTATLIAATAVTLAPGESTDVRISYEATDTNDKQAELRITHTGDNSPLLIALSGAGVTEVPINFGKSDLSGENSDRPTSLQFGPDDRLYVAQQDGAIKIYTIERTAANDYQVTATETLTNIQQIPNHDDDGTVNNAVVSRLVTGLLVRGTAQNPIIYVTSSDPRIGGGGSGADLNLDTNSGVLSRLTWNGASWDKLDLVRGLPRSEENHASNGMAIDEGAGLLYIAQGGLTNMGAPSNNFALLPEFALSAAILSVDLNAIGNTTYDLPTLDDEDKPGADASDPFGGNDGKNQALLVPGGPVQVYAPGFRNPYDVVLTESGRMYTVDNGPNAGWGGKPAAEGPEGNATNQVRNGGATHGDGLHFVTGEGYYGGHPNPTRSNPVNTFNDTNPQSPVSSANPIESDYKQPGSENGSLHVWDSSTNGLTEYTASNFQGSLKGDLLAASFNNSIKRVKTNAAGDSVVLEEQLFSSAGIVPLDVTTVGDSGLFPGTIWVAAIGDGKILVFEPADFGGPSVITPQDENDLDGDGFSNDDETANGTSPNNAADVPSDNDGDFLSDLLDPDDDNDGIFDTSDRFAVDYHNGLTTAVGVSYNWENEGESAGGLIHSGFTGLMTNGIDNYESLFDTTQLTAGGAAGVLTLDSIGEGDATGSLNTQQQAFQFGVNLSGVTTPVTAHTRILAPFASETPQGEQSMGLFIGTGDQDNYYKVVIGATGIQTLLEINGTVIAGPTDLVSLPGPASIDLYLTINTLQFTVQASYEIDGGARINLGTAVAIPPSWIASTSQGMAAGIISTSHGSAPAIPATWDLIEVIAETASNSVPVLAPIPPQNLIAGQTSTVSISATDPNGDDITLAIAGLPAWASFVDHHNGTGTLTLSPNFGDVGSLSVTVTATDDGLPNLTDTQILPLAVLPPATIGEIVYRVNAGGPLVSGTPTWTTDSGLNNAGASQSKPYATSAFINMADASIPVGTPSKLFSTERYDPTSGSEMQWDFDVTPGTYEVRLYFAETYDKTKGVGKRVFDVAIEGNTLLDNYDIFADAGSNAAVMKSFVVQSDGNLDIDFARVVQNPLVRAIEILTAGTSPNQLASSPSALTFGNVASGESTLRTLSLTNQGGDGDPTITVNMADLALSGSGAGDFTVTTTGILSLAPGASVDLTIRYTASTPGLRTANLSLVHSGDNSPFTVALTGVGIPPTANTASAHVEVDAGGSLSSSSTYGSHSFKINNNSPNNQSITSVRFDIDSAMLPDVVFDPNGDAGDPVGKDFTPDSGASQTGLGAHSFSQPLHLGYQALEIAFNDFEPGEQFTFSVDLDPTTIRGASAPGPSAAGSISGLELSGTLVTVTFDDGSSLTSELFRESGSDTSGVATFEFGAPSAPLLQWLNLSSSPTTTNTASQTVRVLATPGSTVRLLHAEAALHLTGVPGGGYDVDPFESNKVISIAEQTFVIGATGFVDIPITLLETGADGGFNHLLAVTTDGNETSEVARLVVEYHDTPSANLAPLLSPISHPTITAGDTQSFLISASDSNSDNLSFSIGNLPAFASLTDHGNGTATLLITPEASDIGIVVIDVMVSDDGVPSLSDNQLVVLTVEEEVVVDPNIASIVYRINAGGPLLPGSLAWSTDVGYTNSGSANSFAFTTSTAINTGDPSLPTGTPAAMFQSERWDNDSGQEMQWDFDVTPGTYEVRLYFAETYGGAQGIGKRVFDVAIEGSTVLNDYDVFANVGGYTGVMKSFTIESDANLDIDFSHVAQNPAIKGIEIVSVAASPALFFASTAEAGSDLDPNGIYPLGQQIAFGLYSVAGQNKAVPTKSNVERVAEEGFNLVGPNYNQDWEDLRFAHQAASQGLKLTYQIRRHPSLVGVSYADRPAAIGLLTDQQIADYVRLQVEAVIDDAVANATVARWSLNPEELRYWNVDEMRYLQVVSETIRQVETEKGEEHRPFWMYQANNRTADQLAITGQHQDIISRGVYQTTRYTRGTQRAGWAMWGYDQITAAAEQHDNTPQAVLQLYEDFTDPLTGTDPIEIERVIRNDVYLALVRGIDSFNVFSMFENRPNLTTHNEQFEAYGSVAKELTGELDLQKIFLFGEERDDLAIEVTSGPKTFEYTHTDGTKMSFPTLNYLNASYGGERYLILVNSTEAPMQVSIEGLPEQTLINNLFTGTSESHTTTAMTVTLEKLGVIALKIDQSL